MPKVLPLILLCCWLFTSPSQAQISAPVDSELCYIVGNGAVFTDPADPTSLPGSQGGIADNYLSCGCFTTTTLCGVDGSAVTVDFTTFSTESNWDWLVILDGDNPSGAELPYSILDDPTNVDLQLFNNAGPFQADPAYGVGPETGIGDLGSFPSTSFTATNPSGCLTFVFRPDFSINDVGWIADVTVASGAAHPGDGLICGANLSCLPPANAEVSEVGINEATFTFGSIDNAQNYTLEFGPAGFAPGSGTTIDLGTDLTYVLGGLDQNTAYDAYLQTNCGDTDGVSALIPLSFTTLISCPDVANFDLITVFASEALFGWSDNELEGLYQVVVDTVGSNPDSDMFPVSVATATDDDVLVTGLTELQTYDAYVRVFCANGDTSNFVGPVELVTCARNDIGVAAVTAPAGSCDLGEEQVTLAITNFGADPQSLFEFHFAVNGEEVSVTRPQDGVFTDVLGKGDTMLVSFDATFDFNEPGTYEVAAWTVLDGDVDITNDTAFLTVNSIPQVNTFPYYEDFETGNGGWTVEDIGGNSTWALGQPMGGTIASAASGTNAWVTNLAGDYENNEDAYLVSPCLDFSSLTSDPILAFALNYDTESCCDEAFMEVTTDGGATWTKLGTADTGLNWYNDVFDDLWNGTDDSALGWVPARQTLTGTAGSSEVRLRFVFSSDFTVVREGIGVDNILIAESLTQDLTAMGAATTNVDCGTPDDVVTLLVGNAGTMPVISFDAAYRINGGGIVTESAAGVIVAPGEVVEYTFSQTFDSSVPTDYTVEAWVSNDEAVLLNDTTTYFFSPVAAAPFTEDFEAGILPAGWAAMGNQAVTDAHNNVSFVVPYNLFGTFSEAQLTTPRVGPLGDADSLFFDYRYTDWSAGVDATTLSADDALVVEISTDCGLSFEPLFTLNGADHVPSAVMTTLAIDLTAYAGQTVNFRVNGIYGSGDYWLDLDNFRVNNCPESLQLSAEVTNATGTDDANGVATVSVGAGAGPFTYNWSNGTSGATQDDLLPGTYEVTVTGAADCTDIIEVVVEITVDTEELPEFIEQLRVQPNPTSGAATLVIELTEAQPLQIELLNSVGHTVQTYRPGRVSSYTQRLDLETAAAGLYFLRVRVADTVRTERVVVMPRP